MRRAGGVLWGAGLALFSLGLAGGCTFDGAGSLIGDGSVDASAHDGDAGGRDSSGDAPGDAEGGMGDAQTDGSDCSGWAFAPTNFDPCDSQLPAPSLDLTFAPGTYTYDTDSGLLTPDIAGGALPSAILTQSDPTAPALRVVVLSSLDVALNATLRVRGSFPVVFAVYGGAAIHGIIDAAAGAGRAPGSDDPIACAAGFGGPGQDSTNSGSGAGGGAGAGFGAKGGDGGDGHGGGHGVHGTHGGANGSVTLSPLQGGCHGGRGGDADMGGSGGDGGLGGGAVQIVARDLLTVTGRIIASGGGGRGGSVATNGVGRSGGGGGGSGGAILLEANDLTIDAWGALCANAGSGAEGSDGATRGADGAIGTCSTTDGATTINSLQNGGDGGGGGFAGNAAGMGGGGGAMGGGGGGGGGSVGRIRVRSNNATVDPAAVITPQAVP